MLIQIRASEEKAELEFDQIVKSVEEEGGSEGLINVLQKVSVKGLCNFDVKGLDAEHLFCSIRSKVRKTPTVQKAIILGCLLQVSRY